MSLEILSKFLSNKLQSELQLDDEKKSIIEYGIYAFMQMFISVFLVAILGYLFNVFIESLIISFVGAILRKYSGGAHASTALNCSIIGVILTVMPSYIISKYYYNVNWIILIGIICCTISYIIIYKLAPVDSPNKPIKKLEKIKKLKRGSIVIFTVYMVIVIFNIILYYITKNNIFLVYSLCIYIGALWQVFTLTKYGHIVVNIIDSLLIKIFNILRGSRNEKIKQ